METISLACKIVGSQARLAMLVGVTPSAVNQWISGNRPVPIERCVAIEKATGGVVTRKDLRPADWQMIWPELMGDEENVSSILRQHESDLLLPRPPSAGLCPVALRRGGAFFPPENQE